MVLLVTFSNVWMYHELRKMDTRYIQAGRFNILNPAGIADIVIKVIGLVLTLTIWPAAMMWAVLITAVVIVIPRAI